MDDKEKTLQITDTIRTYLESREFEHKLKGWTQKTCKEVMVEYWKIVATISAGFMVVIGFTLSLVFTYFTKSIDTLQQTSRDLTESVARLEQTVNILYDSKRSQKKNTRQIIEE